MKTFQACLPCTMNLMDHTLGKTGLDQTDRQALLKRIEADWITSDMTRPPAFTAGQIYSNLLQQTGQDDLFKTHKQNSITEAKKLYPRLKRLAEQAQDPLDAAIRISALGNILDIANPKNYDLEGEIARLLDDRMWGDSLEIFRKRITGVSSLLILADNAGETVFDKVLIETLSVPVYYAVKSAPAFDDALLEDARQAGIDQVAQIIESGTPYPGTYLPSCSLDFQDRFQNAPLILAKGQGNYETLSDVPRDIFFLLKVKCEVVSREIDYPIGSLTLKYKPAEI
jgi:uncharacterized protein with ATP-grasp and redox domains